MRNPKNVISIFTVTFGLYLYISIAHALTVPKHPQAIKTSTHQSQVRRPDRLIIFKLGNQAVAVIGW
jgi:hypothetical protein